MHDLRNKLLARREVVVEASGLDLGERSDIAQSSRRVAMLTKHLRRGVENPLSCPV